MSYQRPLSYFGGLIVPDKVKIILNTRGNPSYGQRQTALIQRALRSAGLKCDLATTRGPGHGLELARQAAGEDWPTIVAAGGDGTVNEVVNGIMAAPTLQRDVALGIIPLGTANDLATMLGLPRSIEAACQRLAAGHTRQIDLGLVNGRYFANNSAVGLEPMVTLAHEQLRRVRGSSRYVLAALKAIASAHPWQMGITWDDGTFEGPTTLVSVGNSPRTGGAFYMTPQAKLDDGYLDFVYAFGMGRLRLLALLPRTFAGKHVNHPLVVQKRTRQLSITVEPASPIQADGEVFEKAAVKIDYRIVPHQLRVLV